MRVRQVRRLAGYGQNAAGFAKFLGITPTRLSNIENGLPLSRQVAEIISQKVPGISWDWLYSGNESALPVAVQRALAAAAETPGKGTSEPSASTGR